MAQVFFRSLFYIIFYFIVQNLILFKIKLFFPYLSSIELSYSYDPTRKF